MATNSSLFTAYRTGVRSVVRDGSGRPLAWNENGFRCQVRQGSSGLPVDLTATSQRTRLTQRFLYDADGRLSGFEGDVIPTEMAYELMLGRTLSPAQADALTDPGMIRFAYGRHAADNTGAVNANSSFTLAAADVKSTRFLIAGQSDYTSKAVINIPPGVFLITLPEAMLGGEANASKISGLKFRGAGRGVTQVIFRPPTAGVLCQARQWLDIEFSDMTLIAQTPGCTLFQTPGTANEQQWSFKRVAAFGWRYIVDPLGTNNCSEVIFQDFSNYAMEDAGAWVRIADTGTSDQFLNYWWEQCKHWSTSAPVIDAAKGGHFHIKQLDFSDWGANAVASPATPGAASALIKLRGTGHNLGVCHASFDGLRGEIKGNNGRLLYSEWGDYGKVSLNDIDITSQSSVRTYGQQMLYVFFGNCNGANYTINDSQLAGGLTVEYSLNSWQFRNEVNFRNTTWADRAGPSDVVTYVAAGAHGNPNGPLVRFEGCGGSGPAYNFSSATAPAVWDATIGMMGISGVLAPRTFSSMKKREVILSGVYGNATSGTMYCRLPLGALVTDFVVTGPAGGTAEGDGGTWTLESDKAGAPVTVGTLTTASALSASVKLGGELTVPFKCGTAARCIMAVTPTNVANAGDIYVILRGYW